MHEEGEGNMFFVIDWVLASHVQCEYYFCQRNSSAVCKSRDPSVKHFFKICFFIFLLSHTFKILLERGRRTKYILALQIDYCILYQVIITFQNWIYLLRFERKPFFFFRILHNNSKIHNSQRKKTNIILQYKLKMAPYIQLTMDFESQKILYKERFSILNQN